MIYIFYIHILRLFQQSSGSGTTAYHLQRALPGGIMLMELAFQVRSSHSSSHKIMFDDW